MTYTADQTGERVDSFLARVMPEFSRSYWQKQCEQGRVIVDDTPVKASRKLTEGEVVATQSAKTPDFSKQSLPILYEDADVLVVNKPAGILTHAKGVQNEEFSVAEFVRPRTTDGVGTNRPGIVHRLDRGTSGVIITAKNTEAKRWLQGQFSKRNVKKTYLALVEGHLKEHEAIINLPIERNPKKPQTFRVGANGKEAKTSYVVDTVYANNDLVRLSPHTGRTHQLRVHMEYLGHPIVGDALYGTENKRLNRMFLHAHTLELTLPNRERKIFTAPLPSELQQYLSTL